MTIMNSSCNSRAIVFCILAFFQVFVSHGQKLKNKDVRRAIEDGKVREVNIICAERFNPELDQELDLKITLQDGTEILASEFRIIWDKARCTITNAGLRIQGELLPNGKGVITPHNLSHYYLRESITVSVDLAGKNVIKVLSPNYCFKNYTIRRNGENGSTGKQGSTGLQGSDTSLAGKGSDGGDGVKGADGPDIELQIDEEFILKKAFIVITFEKKIFMIDPECSTIQVISQGGNGGNGGQGGRGGKSYMIDGRYALDGGSGGKGGVGGNGGNGGTITLRGNAVDKYKSKFTFISVGGEGGASGQGGAGGGGKRAGRTGLKGREGNDGSSGQIIDTYH